MGLNKDFGVDTRTAGDACVHNKGRSRMKPIWIYWTSVGRQAFYKTTFFAKEKVLTGLTVAILALVLQVRLRISPWNSAEKILLTLLLSYLVVCFMAYLKNLLLVPAELDQQKEQEIFKLNSQFKELEAPKLSSYEQKLRSEVKEKTEAYDKDHLSILLFLMMHSKIVEHHLLGIRPLPEKFTRQTVGKILSDLCRDGLVTPEQHQVGGGWEITYKIAEGAAAVLKEVL